MKIGIIGAGMVGRAFAAAAIKQGYEVMIANSRQPDTLYSLTKSLGAKAGLAKEAAEFADVVLLAIPFKYYEQIPAEWLVGKVLIDANNYYPERDGQIALLDNKESTTNEMIASHFSGARVVKAFNAILAEEILGGGKLAGSEKHRAHPIAGDDPQAKKIVEHLLKQFGFEVIDVGNLSEGYRFERGSPAYCIPMDGAMLRQTLEEVQSNN
ncbi:NADPH-dependent F420 reductase [Rouxiella badensis]|uniref:NADPH-dependent F420 reductase n=1 Tax=Rouxiella badensis TaxID=1646377 RepID=UPI001D13C91A|nr:NADPH-dependent F420 reductase [Rouxiella badensis]MCC3705365.1 NADPH-dependent F420 reductase [Rouxiella badensis]